jgi:hypothetical protein
MRRLRRPAQELRAAVECLPEKTKRAMLEGITENDIIVGAYTDRRGGICPMLAAHRHGGRTDFAYFARAWDRYTKAPSRPRPASDREVRTLRTMLEGSLARNESRSGGFGRVIAEHQASARARRAAEAAGTGWAWLRTLGAERHTEPGSEGEQEPEREVERV